MIDDDSAARTLEPVRELFNSSISVLWATTYNLHLELFNEFLLPRLGDPPLNVVVLADYRRIAASLQRIPVERADSLAQVNRRWLLRDVQPLGQAFHAKSYMAVGSGGARLLVGSGNLSLDGLDQGREVFTVFRSGTPVGDLAIDTWRSWTRRLVERLDDVILAERFRDLERRFPGPNSEPTAIPPPLLHNLDVSLSGQLINLVRAPAGRVDELMLSAPYFDANAEAMGHLIRALRPRQIRLFVTGSTSVKGSSLASELDSIEAEVEVLAYEPDQFVHAKLLGIITGDRAWLLTGSPNLSKAALMQVAWAGGNVELAVLAALEPGLVRSLFVPPDVTVAVRRLDDLATLCFNPDKESDSPPVRLVSATSTIDGRIEIRSEPAAEAGWFLDDLTDRQPLHVESSHRIITAGPMIGRLVQLVDVNARVLSNRVVVDDVVALTNILNAVGASPSSQRPTELESCDISSPLAQALVWLHRNLVMDVSERRTATGGVAAGEAETGDDLWERLEREKLARDPRAGAYERLWIRYTRDAGDPIIDLLETLRLRVPGRLAREKVHGSMLSHLLKEEEREPGHKWTSTAKIRVRARNVLKRWASAQNEPALAWVNPLAPAGNFAMITLALAVLRLDRARNPEYVELTDDDLDDIWLQWLSGFAGTREGDGWLGHLDPGTLDIIRRRLPEWLPETVAALCWLAIRPGHDKRRQILTWQPVIAAALNHHLLEPTENTASYVAEIIGQGMTFAKIEERLLRAVEFVDDLLWCERQAAELGLEEVGLQPPPGGAPGIAVRLDVRGIVDPLLDPRIPRLVVALRAYRRCKGVAIWGPDADWRLALVDGQPIAYRQKGTIAKMLANDGAIEQLAGVGGVLASLATI